MTLGFWMVLDPSVPLRIIALSCKPSITMDASQPTKICVFLLMLPILASLQNCTADAKPIKSEGTVVTELLSSLFRQTIYQRIENLLLDPGKKSTAKQQIIESAVDNYHKQKMVMPDNDNSFVQDNTSPMDRSDLIDMTGKTNNYIRTST